jgi:F-type H+-transporting ATPase subunit b
MNPMLLAAGGSWVAPFISQVLAFGLLLFLFFKFALPMMRKGLGARTQSIEEQFAKLDREAREASTKIADLKNRLATIADEQAKRLQSAVDEGNRIRSQSMAEAAAMAQQETDKARRTIQIERDKAVLELRAEVARLTLEVTERAVDAIATEPVHGKIVDRYLERLEGAAKRA